MTGNLIAAGRALLGLSVSQMASKTDLKVSQIKNLEAGTGANGKSIMIQYLAANGIDVDEGASSVTVMIGDEFGKLLIVARAVAGLSQQAIAALSGISLRTISSIEKAGATPTAANRAAISTCLVRQGVSFERDPSDERRWIVSFDPNDIINEVPYEGSNLEDEEAGIDLDEYPNANDRMDIVKLRIELYELNPTVWREITIPSNATFFDLHAAIMIAFGWTGKYSHEFRCGVRIGPVNTDDSHLDFTDDLDERLVRLDHVFYRTGDFEYRYGKGEHWLATITMIDRIRGDRTPVHPLVVDGKGAGVPEEAHAEQWTNDAAALRKGKGSKETLDWLHFLGYGRDYNPDHLDIEAINADMAGAGFSIPSTRKADYLNRKAIAKSMQSVLPTEYPKKAEKPKFASSAFVISKVEECGVKDVVFDPEHGLAHTYPKKAGGNAQIRATHADIAHMLDIAPDVVSFRTFPLNIHWSSASGKGVFQPDLEVTDTSGRTYLVHVVYNEAEEQFVRAIANKIDNEMHVIASGFLNEQCMDLCNRIDRSIRWVKEEESSGICEALKVSAGSSIPMNKALRDLVIAGFGKQMDGFTGGSPESTAISRLSLAIAQGHIGMDFGRPFERTTVGDPKMTAKTLNFGHLVRKYS